MIQSYISIVPSVSQTTLNSTDVHPGPMRSKHQEGIKHERILLEEMPMGEQLGKKPRRLMSHVNHEASLTPSEGEREGGMLVHT